LLVCSTFPIPTHYVELSLARLARRVQCDYFRTKQVLAGSHAGRHREVDPATSRDHPIDTPASRAIESVLEYFEPFEALTGSRRGVIDLCPEGVLVLPGETKRRCQCAWWLTCRIWWGLVLYQHMCTHASEVDSIPL